MVESHATDGSGFKEDMHRMGESVDKLRDDASSLAHGAVAAAHSGAVGLRQEASHAVDVAKGKLNDAKQSADDAIADVKDLIVRNPWAAAGIMAGVGLLVGMVLARPRS